MKVVVIGGTGLIGSKLVARLSAQGHEAIAASPASGVDTVTGAGLDEVLRGAAAVVDVTNSPSFADQEAKSFFETSTRNLLAAEGRAGVEHHVALSVVGTERLVESGYFRAKLAQERLVQLSSIPYSIVHATQFFEFVKMIAGFSVQGESVRLPPILVRPIAADDVAAALAAVAVGAPLNATLEVAGPTEMGIDAFVRRGLEASQDPRKVVTDPSALYFGIHAKERTLVPEGASSLGKTTFEQWLAANAA
jgi:uncharacterized protein YbjT (DUF2867 family)